MRQRSPVGPSPRGASVGGRWRRDSAWPLRGERRSHHGGQRSRGRYTGCWWQLRWHWRWWHRSRGRHRRQSHASRRRRWHGVRQRWPWGQAVHQRRRRWPLHGRRAWREVRRSWGLLHFEVELKEELGRGREREKSKEKGTINPQDNTAPSHNGCSVHVHGLQEQSAVLS